MSSYSLSFKRYDRSDLFWVALVSFLVGVIVSNLITIKIIMPSKPVAKMPSEEVIREKRAKMESILKCYPSLKILVLEAKQGEVGCGCEHWLANILDVLYPNYTEDVWDVAVEICQERLYQYARLPLGEAVFVSKPIWGYKIIVDEIKLEGNKTVYVIEWLEDGTLREFGIYSDGDEAIQTAKEFANILNKIMLQKQ